MKTVFLPLCLYLKKLNPFKQLVIRFIVPYITTFLLKVFSSQSVSTEDGLTSSVFEEPQSASLDVVFELPEVLDVQQAGVDVIVTPSLRSSLSGEEDENESMFKATDDAPVFSPSLSPLEV